MADRHTCDTQRSYSREEKLIVTQWYWNNGRNLHQTCKNFNLNSKTVVCWIKGERKIRASRKGRKRVEFDRKPQYPALEDTLYQEYRNHRQRGVKIKGWWFKTRAKQLLQATAGTSVSSQFKFSDAWFDGFKRRYNISLRRPTNKAQSVPVTKKQLIQNFHRKIRQEAAVGPQIGKLGQFNTCNLANVDQTPLPFTFTNGPTYEEKGAKTVWVQGGSSGLDKRQCTVQLTLFADGVPRVRYLKELESASHSDSSSSTYD